MDKSDKTTKQISAFQRFENLTKSLLVVPHKELKEKLDRYKQRKTKHHIAIKTDKR